MQARSVRIDRVVQERVDRLDGFVWLWNVITISLFLLDIADRHVHAHAKARTSHASEAEDPARRCHSA